MAKGDVFPADTLIKSLRDRHDKLIAGAERALALSTLDGAVHVQDLLEEATTATGRSREEKRGGFPGRHDTGNMVASVNENGETPEIEGSAVWGSFGWFPGEFEAYFEEQDLGEGNIPAADALPGAFVYAREKFIRRIRQAVANEEVS